jgi:DNA-directed RNA polymerase specialized sigma24 family protein
VRSNHSCNTVVFHPFAIPSDAVTHTARTHRRSLRLSMIHIVHLLTPCLSRSVMCYAMPSRILQRSHKKDYYPLTLNTIAHTQAKHAEEASDAPQMTRWSLIARARETDEELRMEAMNALLQTYLPVLQWYLTRHTGLGFHEREDLIQGFVTRKILDQDIISRADRSRGRFRSFLLGAFQNYIRDELRKQNAARRAPPGGHLLPLEEADGVSNGDREMERELRQIWLRQTVAQAAASMQKTCTAEKREDVWSIFASRLLDPMLGGDEPEPYEVLVARLGLESPSQASNLLVTAKRMFARHLRQAVAETVSDPEQAEEELQELKKSL